MDELKPLPSSDEMERAVIGGVILDNNSINSAVPWISSPHAFWKEKNRVIWLCLNEMHKEKIPIDLITTNNYIKENYPDKYDPFYVAECFNSVISSEHVDYYAKELQKKYLQRLLAKSTQKLNSKSYQKFDENLLLEHENLIRELRELRPRKDKPVSQIIEETIIHIKTADNIIKFGNRVLDDFAGGITKKEVVVIGGRPGHGKSTSVVNITKGLIEQGYKVCVFNREMNNTEMTKKLITLETPYLSYKNVRYSTLSAQEMNKIEETSEMMKTKYKNLIMYDDIRTMEEAVREVKRQRPDVIIDDYIQKIITSNNKDRRFQLEDIMNEYSWLAKDINGSAILVSQLNREIEKRHDPRPRMSDFAESGAIEQVAELALFVFFGYYFDSTRYTRYQFEYIGAKVRYGEIGTYEVGFNGNRCKMYLSAEEASLGI